MDIQAIPQTVNDFFKSNLFGLIILSILTSIIWALIYEKAKEQIKRRGNIKHLASIGVLYTMGYRTAYAQSKGTFHQILFVITFVTEILCNLGWIIVYLLFAIASLLIFNEYLNWIPCIIFSTLITFKYKNLKWYYKYFSETINAVYGDEYLKAEKEAMKSYWNELHKPKN